MPFLLFVDSDLQNPSKDIPQDFQILIHQQQQYLLDAIIKEGYTVRHSCNLHSVQDHDLYHHQGLITHFPQNPDKRTYTEKLFHPQIIPEYKISLEIIAGIKQTFPQLNILVYDGLSHYKEVDACLECLSIPVIRKDDLRKDVEKIKSYLKQWQKQVLSKHAQQAS